MRLLRRNRTQLQRHRFECRGAGGQALGLELIRLQGRGRRTAIACFFEPGSRPAAPDPGFLAQAGFAVITVPCRPTSCRDLPQQLRDAAAALGWIGQNAGRLRIDKRGIGLWGHSLGGTLTALLGLHSVRRTWLDESSPVSDFVSIDAIVDSCSPSGLYLDLLFGEDQSAHAGGGPYWERQTSLFRARQSKDRGSLQRSIALNPVNSIAEMRCPYLLCHTTGDSIWSLSDMTRYYRECRAQGVDVALSVEDPAPGAEPWRSGAGRVLEFFEHSLKRRKSAGSWGRMAVSREGGEVQRFSDILCADDPGFGDYLTLDAWVDPIRWTPPGCRFETFFSHRLGQEVSYLLSLPPTYEDGSQQRYPLTCWLHPTIQGPRSLAQTVVPLTRSWELEPGLEESILVFPNHCAYRSGRANGEAGIAEMLSLDLPAHLDSRLRIRTDARSRLLAGHSGSGPLTLDLALRFPSAFGRAVLFAPAYRRESAARLATLSNSPGDLPEVILVYGSDDEIPSLREGFGSWERELGASLLRSSILKVPGGRHAIESLFPAFAESSPSL